MLALLVLNLILREAFDARFGLASFLGGSTYEQRRPH
jgi:hypothetical protein